MTLTAIAPILAVIAGLLIYALSSNAKVAEVGRLTFFVGLFMSLLVLARHVVKL